MDRSSQVLQKYWAIFRTWELWSGHLFRVRWYRVLWTGSCSPAPHITFNMSGEKCTCWMLWLSLMERFSQQEGKCLRQSVRIMSCLDLYSMMKSYFCIRSNMYLNQVVQHGWAYAGPSPGAYGHSAL